MPGLFARMKDPFFFGYGSLVNKKTHGYDRTHKAQLKGWTRIWRHTSNRAQAFLSVHPMEGRVLEGLIAHVPDNDWSALDLREHGYERQALDRAQIAYDHDAPIDIQMYQVTHDLRDAVKHPILLSYLDVVVQGYLRVFGEAGVARFFETTEGWDAPILNDRNAPKYPRHQTLDTAELALVDTHLENLSAEIKQI